MELPITRFALLHFHTAANQDCRPYDCEDIIMDFLLELKFCLVIVLVG